MLKQIGTGIVVGVLLFIALVTPMLDLYCSVVLDEPYGFIGCAVKN